MSPDIHDEWPHRWVTSKAGPGDSKVHGLGVFANSRIEKGEIVAVLGGVIIPSCEIKEYWRRMGHVGIQISDKFFIVPTSREELEKKGVFNHSCSPNIGFLDDIQFIAIKTIEEGEELVFDYSFNETLNPPFDCNCGSENCRGIIGPGDWRDEKIQEEFGDYFSPYLKRKISN